MEYAECVVISGNSDHEKKNVASGTIFITAKLYISYKALTGVASKRSIKKPAVGQGESNFTAKRLKESPSFGGSGS